MWYSVTEVKNDNRDPNLNLDIWIWLGIWQELKDIHILIYS